MNELEIEHVVTIWYLYTTAFGNFLASNIVLVNKARFHGTKAPPLFFLEFQQTVILLLAVQCTSTTSKIYYSFAFEAAAIWNASTTIFLCITDVVSRYILVGFSVYIPYGIIFLAAWET